MSQTLISAIRLRISSRIRVETRSEAYTEADSAAAGPVSSGFIPQSRYSSSPSPAGIEIRAISGSYASASGGIEAESVGENRALLAGLVAASSLAGVQCGKDRLGEQLDAAHGVVMRHPGGGELDDQMVTTQRLGAIELGLQ